MIEGCELEYQKHKKGYRAFAWLLFGVYVVLMIYFLFFAESMGRVTVTSEYHYNLQPFKEILRYLKYYRVVGVYAVCLNLLGNVVAFVPFGLFFPLLSRRNRSFWKVSFLSFEISLLVEVIQLVTRVGCCDVDDVMLNTVGGMIGYACFKTLWTLHWGRRKGAVDESEGA